MVALIQDVSHQLRQVDNALLGFFGVDIYQSMNVVESVHKEMWMKLIFQVLKLLLEVFFLQHLYLTAGNERAEVEFHTYVGADAEEEEYYRQNIMPAERWRCYRGRDLLLNSLWGIFRIIKWF